VLRVHHLRPPRRDAEELAWFRNQCPGGNRAGGGCDGFAQPWGLVLAILFGARAGAADDPKPTGHAAPGLRFLDAQPDGVNFAILFNASPGEKKDPDNTAAAWRKSIIEAIRNIQDWPQSDFFEKFP
jgi:hypothetical protein